MYQLYIREVLAFLAQDATIDDGNLSDRIFTVASDIFEIESVLADVSSRRVSRFFVCNSQRPPLDFESLSSDQQRFYLNDSERNVR